MSGFSVLPQVLNLQTVASDTTQGHLRLYSDATGSDIGGALWLYVNPDYDATVNHYVIDVTQDDLNIGPSDFEGSLKYLASVNQWRFGEGEMSVGSPDTTRGTIYAYGQATGSTNGGRLLCYTAVDHDTTIDYYILQATSDDFTIGPITDTDALKYDGGTGNWWMTNADLLVMNTTQGYAQLLVGNDGDHRGSVNIFGNATGSTNGGQIRLYLADDHDGTIAEYKINVLSDDLLIGPSTNTDALKYDGGNNYWVVDADLNPSGDGTLDLGIQTTAQWANVWADLVNGADYSLLNKWRILESDKYEGYPDGFAIGNEGFKDGVVTEKMPKGLKPVFAVTEEFIEYDGCRITPAQFKKLTALVQ
jgi:hypothetical protein